MPRGSPSSALIDLHGLGVFLAVADTLSMTAAGLQVGMTQSAVSQAVARLEGVIGVQLVDRDRRPLGLTAAGGRLAAEGHDYLEAGHGLVAEVRAVAETSAPTVRLGLVDSFAATVGPALIRALRRDIEQITVWSGISPNLWRDLMEDRLDLIISSAPVRTRSVSSVPLLTEPFMFILPESLAAHMPVPRLADLAQGHPFVRYSIRSQIGAQIEKILDDDGVEAPRSLEFDGTDSVMPMVAAGLGWAITTPLCLIHGRAFAADLTIKPIRKKPPTRTLYLISKTSTDDVLTERVAREARRVALELIDGPVMQMAPGAAREMAVH